MVCQLVIYWDGASNTCFFLSSSPLPAPWKTTAPAFGLLQHTAWNGRAPEFEPPKWSRDSSHSSTALVCEKPSRSKHARNSSASPSAFSLKTLMAKTASEICKICTCSTWNVQTRKCRQQMCRSQSISQVLLGQLECCCCQTSQFLSPATELLPRGTRSCIIQRRGIKAELLSVTSKEPQSLESLHCDETKDKPLT